MRSTLLVAGGFAAAALLLPAVATAAPEFLAYEGKNAIHEGQGGEKKTVDGVDFWMSGDPPHRFMVLGSLTDRRHKTGIYGMIRMSGLDDDIANAAKAAGGDAVILQGEDDDVVGIYSGRSVSVYGTGGPGWGQASGFSSGISRPIEAHDSKYLVVKYLPDDPAVVTAPVVSPPALAPAPGPATPASP
jgi:hypothetical protein